MSTAQLQPHERWRCLALMSTGSQCSNQATHIEPRSGAMCCGGCFPASIVEPALYRLDGLRVDPKTVSAIAAHRQSLKGGLG